MSKNSFFHPVNEIHFGTYKPTEVKTALEDAIKHAADTEKGLLAVLTKDRTYENTIQALNDSTDKIELVAGVVSHLAGVLGGPWHKPDEHVSEKLASYFAKRGLNKKLYQAIMTIWDTKTKLGLSPAQIRLVEDYKKGFERNGIALPEGKKTRLKAIRARLAKLSSKFERNTTEGSDKAYLLVKKLQDLSGIDAELIDLWQQAAKKRS